MIVRGHFPHATALPIVYALLENKRLSSYLTVVQFLADRCPLLNPVTIDLDFEQNEHKAFLTVFPNATLQCCLFHFDAQQLKRFMKMPNYLEDEQLRPLLNSVYGLPFLPVHDILPAWTELKTTLFTLRPTQYMSKYIHYFETTWLFSSVYPPSIWNVSSAVEYEEPWTNNVMEGGNNALARMFSSSHPSMWMFIKGLLSYHSKQELKYEQLAQGIVPNEPQRRKWREREGSSENWLSNTTHYRKWTF